MKHRSDTPRTESTDPPPGPSHAHLFVSHRSSPVLMREFLKIRGAADGQTVVWAHDAGADEPAPDHEHIPVFNFEPVDLARTWPTFMGDAIVPGNAHYVMLDYWRRNPSFDHYWFIEYDVRFAGDWAVLFDYFRHNPSDFLSAYVRRWNDRCSWSWWHHLTHPSRNIPLVRRLRSFNPIYRISNRALSIIDRCHRDGWAGHHEVLLPTLLSDSDCRIEDFGGQGEFVPPDRRNRFYHRHRIVRGNIDSATGTHRFQPPKPFAGIRRNRIHHPIKPLGQVLDYYLKRIRRKLRA